MKPASEPRLLESPGILKFPFSNRLHIHVERLEETLRIYERDSVGFLDQIPRLR